MKLPVLFFAFTLTITAHAKLGAPDVWTYNARDIGLQASLDERNYAPLYALTEREVQTELYERQAAAEAVINSASQVVQIAQAVEPVISKIFHAITANIQKDKNKRGQWTSALMDKLGSKYPQYNFAVCHTSHKMDAQGKQGQDWGHIHHEVPVSMGKTVGYELYWFKQGTFYRYGDGGYLNWAYTGNIKSTTNGGKTVVFGPR